MSSHRKIQGIQITLLKESLSVQLWLH